MKASRINTSDNAGFVCSKGVIAFLFYTKVQVFYQSDFFAYGRRFKNDLQAIRASIPATYYLLRLSLKNNC
jgi:hypothetical protein